MIVSACFTGAAFSLAVTGLLIMGFPDAWDGMVLNPLITLAKYLLPAAALFLLLEGAWVLTLVRQGKKPRGMGVALMNKLLERWDRRNNELLKRTQGNNGSNA